MKKLNFCLILLIFCCQFCAQNQGEHATDTKTEQDTKSEEDLIVNSEHLDFSQHKVTFIELGADKCIPCKAMQPIMREIAKEYKGKIQVVFYDVWKTPKYAKDYGIRMIPTQIFFDKSGYEISRHVGFFAKNDIIKMLKEKGSL